MGKRLAIPRILGINWWWLFWMSAAEGIVSEFLHFPVWAPSIVIIWSVGQLVWLRIAEPRSRALYALAATWALSILFAMYVPKFGQFNWQTGVGVILSFATGVAVSFLTRSELLRHFNETDPRELQLSKPMTFFFGSWYFQYWFHQLYLEQQVVAEETEGLPGPLG